VLSPKWLALPLAADLCWARRRRMYKPQQFWFSMLLYMVRFGFDYRGDKAAQSSRCPSPSLSKRIGSGDFANKMQNKPDSTESP
jgi:hypothetical protein